jgi:hypothetical protein
LAIGGIGADGIKFTTASSGSATERMRIDSSGNVGIGTTSATAKLVIAETTAARASRIIGNGNAQGTAQKCTIVRHYPVVSLGTKLIIPFVSQGDLACNTIIKIWGHSARFNNSDEQGFSATFTVAHLATTAVNTLESLGNISSITNTGMDIELNFTNAYTSATANGIFVTIEYMTNSLTRSIDVPNIAMN